ncbi:HNH-endonuclease [Brevibacterium phage AGM12]|uniref:HNH-endonuclease n=3 Tax=Agmunavirus AGM1 TaxID=2843882 RepID=A0A7D0KHD4_9CAUD|nr:HNH-endonuclease [Brevibacterium phage AGM12]WNO48341.1 HNH-endonuclease [Brevibacterium phage 8C]WNO48447.1 HNH-endonuclease [Brevibacterium phage 10C]
MAWLRTGDNVANHPIVLAVLEHPQANDNSVNETFGFIMRCALQSAAHFTDYVISYGTALALAGSKSQADRLLELATSAGYITPAETLDGKPVFKLIEDSDFIHIRSKEEIDFERQRDRDRKDQGLTVPVWIRDGDSCRYCRRIVQWNDKKSQRSGTFDHLSPGSAATHDTYVVACRGCNSALSDLTFEERSQYLLLTPTQPHYSREGVQYWKDTKWFKDNNVVVPKPTTASKLKPGDFIPGATKISAFIQDVQKRNRTQADDDTQSPTAPVLSSGPMGSTDDTQSPVDPAEPSSRGPKGMADRTSVHPARDTDYDGPKGTAGSTPVHPASQSPTAPVLSSGPMGSTDDTQSPVDPAEPSSRGPKGMADRTSVHPARDTDYDGPKGTAGSTPVHPASQSPTAPVLSSGPMGSTDDTQSPVDPAEPSSRGPKGMADRTSVHPARDTDCDGPKGTAGSTPVHPASQSPTAPVLSSGPMGSTDDTQSPVDPAEPSSRGPKGMADRTSVHPARDTDCDGPKGTAGSTPVHPASQSPTAPVLSSGPMGSTDDTQSPVDPAEPSSRGPKGMADRTSVHPARDTDCDGPKGTAGSTPVHPASQSPTAPVLSSGPMGSTDDTQSPVDPAEPSSRGPKGMADRTSVHPARDTDCDGPKGTAGSTPVHPASQSHGDGPSDSPDNPSEVDPASPPTPPDNNPVDLAKHRSRNDPGIIPQSAAIEGWNIWDVRDGSGRDGLGLVGSGRVGTGLDGSGARQRPVRPSLPATSSSKRSRRRKR